MMWKKTIYNFSLLNLDFPEGNKDQIFDLTNELILNDSWPFKISTSTLPFLVVLILLFTK